MEYKFYDLKEVDEVIIVTILSDFNVFSSSQIMELFSKLTETPSKGVIIIFNKDVDIDSYGVSELLRLYSALEGKKIPLKLVVTSERILYILKIDKLFKIIPIYQALDEALESFKKHE